MKKSLKIAICGLMMLAVGLSVISCSDDDVIGDKVDEITGYVYTFFGPMCVNEEWAEVSAEAGEATFTLRSNPDEDVIPIVYITTDGDNIAKSADIADVYHEVHKWGLSPRVVYREAGLDTYPNDLSYLFSYQWVSCSSVKRVGEQNGTLYVKWENNPYNTPRIMYIYMKNQDSGTLILAQEANPDGITPTAK